MKYPAHKGGNFMSPLHSQPHVDKEATLRAGEGWQILVRDRMGIPHVHPALCRLLVCPFVFSPAVWNTLDTRWLFLGPNYGKI